MASNPETAKWNDQSTKALDKARDLDSGLYHLEQASLFIKSPAEAVADSHKPVGNNVLYTTNIPASKDGDVFKVVASPRGHIKVFGKGLVFSSIFNKRGTRKALNILTEGARKAGMIAKDSPKNMF
jgi:hypothetical protein